MEAKKVQKGGARRNAGRKTKVKEQTTMKLFSEALKELYGVKQDDTAKKRLIKELMQDAKGRMFVAEHLFGKPTEKREIAVTELPKLTIVYEGNESIEEDILT